MRQGTLKTSEGVMAQESRFGRLIRELARPVNVGLALLWIGYLYIWARGWADSELFNPTWWFDAAGHMAFGFFGALSLLYLFRRYSVKGVFNIAGGLFISISIIGVITILGVIWEGFELWWDWKIQPDYFQWIAKAQKNSIDTTIDILINTICAAVAMIMAAFSTAIYRWMYPDEFERSEVEETLARIEYLSRDLRAHRTEQIRYMMRRDLIPKIKGLMRSVKQHLNRKPRL